MSIRVEAVAAKKIGFASHQNAVPVIRELIIHNQSDDEYQDIVLTLTASPPVIEEKTWKVDRLTAQSELFVRDRDLKLNASWLADLTESVTGELTFTLSRGDDVLLTTCYPIELLAKNEWGGDAMVELTSAFVMPNDPAVDKLLKATSEVLRRAGKPDQLDGYTSHSRTRTWELASAVWSAIANTKLTYALPPASFERIGQKIRTPGVVMEGQVATCLDTSLLFASVLEQLGLNPLIILAKEHAFVGLWLQPQEFSQLVTEDVSAVRKRLDLKEMVVFETTLVTSFPVAAFSHAVETAQRHLTEDAFVAAVDVRRARMQKIRPLALGVTHSKGNGDAIVSEDLPDAFEEAPLLPGFDVEIETNHDASDTNRLIQWQRKLLDLTTRNRLLHLPESAKGIRLICSNAADLEDKLAEGKRIRIVALPDLEIGGRDVELYQQQSHENLREEYARQALERGEAVSGTDKTKLEAALIDLYRKSKSDLEEGGANTLFLALGFLKWKKSPEDPKSYSAPLILLPIQLDRKSALSGVSMRSLEEEPRFNLTLLELLRNDFALSIPGLEGELPTDESGIDVEGIWNTVRRAVRDMPGFEVTRDVIIGTFSFAKYLMWKDLIDRSEQLMQSSLVKFLVERGSGQESLPANGEFASAEELDSKLRVEDLFIPLPADSSQLAAVVASAKGRDFVLDGPPGTGKSQTIANMIAYNLALGRRVLFVAEKKAALDVVARRLEAKGLGEFCLELHSSKTSKVEFLKQLERAWDSRDALSAKEWQEESLKVQRLRDKLNNIVRLLHKRWPNGLTLHQAMGRVIKDANASTPRFTWPGRTHHTAEQMAQMRDVVRRLELNRQAATGLGQEFALIKQLNWTNGWQESLASTAKNIPRAIDNLENTANTLSQALGLSDISNEQADMENLQMFSECLLRASGINLSFMFAFNATGLEETVTRALALLDEINQGVLQLSQSYPHHSWLKVDTEQCELNLQLASKKFWFFATKAKKKLIGEYVLLTGIEGVPDLSSDLNKIKDLQRLNREIEQLADDIKAIPGWNGLQSDSDKINQALMLAGQIRGMFSLFASSPQQLSDIRKAAQLLLIESNDLLGPQGIIAAQTAQLKQTLSTYDELKTYFGELTHQTDEAFSLSVLRQCAQAITDNTASLKAWCDWCRVHNEAQSLGLEPLAVMLVQQAIPEGSCSSLFETAYSRWFANWVIDADPQLHNFVPAEHMSDIESYRRQSDMLSSLTVRYIRAKLCGVIPAKNEVGKKDGYAVLKHELQKSRRHKPVRQMASEMGDAMGKLAPCMLMSPLSVAQYLPANQPPFDLVIFDEASQITPWDAIGTMARGKQVVIAGDPRQMPPTSFFNRGASDSDDDTEGDMESILEECLAAGMYNHTLSWHYRSRHESLIAFSNHRYYDSNLITFPAAQTKQSAVEWRKVEGVYSKGKGRHNQAEAEAIVAETVKRLTDPQFVASGKSIGIITLNTEQQKLISDLLDRARQIHPQIEPFFQQELEEPVVVKNLETVQGDERDLIMLGISYGPTEPGANTMSMNFGPLNREGGWRRLNVAVTRARHEMLVFSSFEPSMIDLNRTSARAVQDLKHFIEFAQRGPVALAQAIRGSVGGYDSPFEEAVANGLRQKGWNVIPQIGVSRFRIDLGIVHPDRPGDYLVGVECDGATYHSAATARDRDKVRSAILEGLGWTLLRLWSTDWWIDKESALEKLHLGITSLLDASREQDKLKAAAEAAAAAEQKAQQPLEVVPDVIENAEVPLEDEDADHQEQAANDDKDEENDLVYDKKKFASLRTSSLQHNDLSGGSYQVSNLQQCKELINPELFYEAEYDKPLQNILDAVLNQEAPMLDNLLIQRIARAHGFNRSGRLIRERILELVDKHYHLQSDPISGDFVWVSSQQQSEWCNYRLPVTDEDVRAVDEIASEELFALARKLDSKDKVQEMAKQLGIKRITSKARARLELVLSE